MSSGNLAGIKIDDSNITYKRKKTSSSSTDKTRINHDDLTSLESESTSKTENSHQSYSGLVVKDMDVDRNIINKLKERILLLEQENSILRQTIDDESAPLDHVDLADNRKRLSDVSELSSRDSNSNYSMKDTGRISNEDERTSCVEKESHNSPNDTANTNSSRIHRVKIQPEVLVDFKRKSILKSNLDTHDMLEEKKMGRIANRVSFSDLPESLDEDEPLYKNIRRMSVMSSSLSPNMNIRNSLPHFGTRSFTPTNINKNKRSRSFACENVGYFLGKRNRFSIMIEEHKSMRQELEKNMFEVQEKNEKRISFPTTVESVPETHIANNNEGEKLELSCEEDKCSDNLDSFLSERNIPQKQRRHTLASYQNIDEIKFSFFQAHLNNVTVADMLKSQREFLKQQKDDKKMVFQQFAMLTVRPETILSSLDSSCNSSHLKRFDSSIKVHGSRFLDPFSIDTAEIIDNFPSSSMSSKAQMLDPNVLSPFCFPGGVRIYLVPRRASEGAKRMGRWIGKTTDQYHVLSFTDGYGSSTYGVAIIINEELTHFGSPDQRKQILKHFDRLRKRRCAAVAIARFWKRRYQFQCKQSRQEYRKTSKYPFISRKQTKTCAENESQTIENKENTCVQKKVQIESICNLPSMKKAGTSRSKTIAKAIGRKIKRKNKKKTRKAFQQKIDNIPSKCIDGLDYSYQGFSIGDFDKFKKNEGCFCGMSAERDIRNKTLQIELMEPESNSKKLSGFQYEEKCLIKQNLTNEAFEVMEDARKSGDICIIQKCYVLIGCDSQDQALLFATLQQVIDSERVEKILSRGNVVEKTSSTIAKPESHRRGFSLLSSDKIFIQNIINGNECDVQSQQLNKKEEGGRESLRHILLSYIQTNCVFDSNRLYVESKNPLSRRRDKGKFFYFKLPLPNISVQKIPLPPPRIDIEWGFAKLLLCIDSERLFMALKLLLLERSLLVIGESTDEVTACSLALVELIKPFEWAGAFLPIVPECMRDIVSSPVPFLVGMVTYGEQELKEFEKSSQVHQALLNGMSILNLSTGALKITSEKGIRDMVFVNPNVLTLMKNLQSRLHTLSPSDKLPLHVLPKFCQEGLSSNEKVTLQSAHKIIREYVTNLAGDIAKFPEAWKKLGSKDALHDEFVFYPSSFIKPLQDELKFQETMVHTQLFLEFVNKKQRDTQMKQEMISNHIGRQISNWIYIKWKMKKKLSTN